MWNAPELTDTIAEINRLCIHVRVLIGEVRDLGEDIVVCRTEPSLIVGLNSLISASGSLEREAKLCLKMVPGYG